MLKYVLIFCLFVFAMCETGLAQGPLKKKLRDAARRGANNDSDNDSDDKRNDFEGAVWEFKVIDRKEKDKSKQTKMTGRLRIKQTAIFSIGDVDRGEKNKAAPDNKTRGDGKLKDIVADRLKSAMQDDVGSERIGDVSKKGKEYVFQFDQDDDHPLSGRAELKPDAKQKGGVWFGKYVEYLEDNKKKSWRMEIRKIDE